MYQENSINSEQSRELNFGRYLRLILMQSKLVLSLTLAGFFLSTILYFSTPQTFKISSLLQVYNTNQAFDPRQSLSLDFYNAPETNLDNLLSLYTSRSNIINLIINLNLNIEIEGVKDNQEVLIDSFLLRQDEDFSEKIFYLKNLGDSYSLLDVNKNQIIKGVKGDFLENNFLKIKLNYINLEPNQEIKIIYTNPSDLYRFYKNTINVGTNQSRTSLFVQEGLIQVHLISEDTEIGKKIVDEANKIFISDSINVETEKAKKSIEFIDRQLESLEGILDLRKNQLRSFKQENKSLNVNLEVQSIIEQIALTEEKINKIDLELSQAEINFTSDNPLYLNLKIQKDALLSQKDLIEKKIEDLPTAQQEYIDLFRNLETSEQLFAELANRKLNYSLIEASTIGNIRVVDSAFIENLVGPRTSIFFFFTIVFFFLGMLLAIFRGIFFISVSNPAELKDAGLEGDIIGVVPKVESSSEPFKDIKFQQCIETTILNIETIIGTEENKKTTNNCTKVVFTSPTPENGKSFVSKNIASGLARIGHKVLLIDADLKRGDQHKFFEKEPIDLSFFKNINSENIKDLQVNDNLYLLPRLKKLKNTFEHLYGNLFLEKVKEFENLFDYIIFDTAPALSVSDTGLLMSSSDINVLIVRHEVNKINEIKQTLQIINQIGRSFDGIIYNDYQRPRSYYGYYDLYGDYSYRYYAERYLYKEYYDENKI